ncbi:hypothetical protein [Devosia chinhatensis]|uniref:Uncharacterized protein n=1 Tax=Devosia chinhatensis TaxID=429727 RepID=A0A0F5FEZ2_9HYPH|nr:hypothetical protein [Devosia chinhatensis]KKB07489.1 hypothetical protein VE26_12090 [Devosia chinhatensis]
MATTALFHTAAETRSGIRASASSIFTVLGAAAFVPGLFGVVNIGAEAVDLFPFFFAPFGLPGWAGGAMHLVQLSFLGAAFGLMMLAGATRATIWLAVSILAYIALPFVTPPLDSLQLSLVCTGLFLLGLATAYRVGSVSPLAGWLMTPMLAIVGFSAAMGLVLTAAYTPPFALVQGQTPAPASA